MSAASRRERWRAEVFRSKRITDSTRVLLLAMAERMRADGRVSVPRGELVRIIDRDTRRITERINLAIEAGLLDRVAAGGPGHTAEYVALLPQGAPVRTTWHGADTRSHSGAPVRTNFGGEHGAPVCPANNKGSRSGTPTGSRDDHELAAEIAQAVSRKTGADVNVGMALRWLREMPGVADARNPVGFVISTITKDRRRYLESTPTPPPFREVANLFAAGGGAA